MASLRPGAPSAGPRCMSKEKLAPQPEAGGLAGMCLPHTVPRSLSIGASVLGHEEGESELTSLLLKS